MAYGLIVKNAAGSVVIDTNATILNSEKVSVSSATIPASGSATVTVEGADVAGTVLVELSGAGAEDVTASATAADTYTLTNTSSVESRTVDIEFWRLK